MGRIFVFAVALGAAGFAFNQYTGKNPVYALQSFVSGGGGGGFAGGYGMAVDSSRSIGGSAAGLASGVSDAFGSIGN
ncbi:MAG: hypothetical protein HKP37_02380 [Boseongicola sp.]|nr:hypothetical protein [Boseongicola sp.]NNL17566.1 hypothetical protein [Boseongicola sp.]